ncbi:hypothetical protein L1049_006024 [Liquidambar formosana]|uniref:Mitotic checkpoint protein BUB3.3 n=1 Tax=Liquidambar formosana TaxID=63359 RepID=A0AAP0WTL5_LIQFO
MSGACLEFENPINDAISRIRFAPQSNSLLISSWDSNLRLYDVDSFMLRLEAAPAEGALLDCCFQNDSVAFTAGSDCFLRRYDLHSGIHNTIGNHDDSATCVEYSDETCQVITAGWDKRIMFWDPRMSNALGGLKFLGAEVESMSLSMFNLMVAIGASVHTYDLRNLDKAVQGKESCMDLRLRCVRSISNSKGFTVGSIDGRVALEILNPSNSNDIGYAFRCHPKSKDGRDHLVAVNDIVFNPSYVRLLIVAYYFRWGKLALIGCFWFSDCGAFVTGDNEGYVIAWDARSRKRLFELPRYPNSVASLSYNYGGQLLAVASTYTYQEANELEEPPRIFIHRMDDGYIESVSAGRSSRK